MNTIPTKVESEVLNLFGSNTHSTDPQNLIPSKPHVH